MTAGNDLDRAVSALLYLSPDCSHARWFNILAAFKSVAGEAGKEIADQWSQGPKSYDKASFNSTWRSIDPQGGIKAGTLFMLAKDEGWIDNNTPGVTRAFLQAVPTPVLGDKKPSANAPDISEIRNIFSSAPAASPEHRYLVDKKIKPHGTKERHGKLLLPISNKKNQMISMQSIAANGYKEFSKYIVKTAGFMVIGVPQVDATVCYIGEGFATVASACEATDGAMGLIAFTAANLPTVVEIFPELHSKMVILADNDMGNEVKYGENIGMKVALKASSACGVPYTFCDATNEENTDFNDVLMAYNSDAVKVAIAKNMTSPVQRDNLEAAQTTWEDPESFGSGLTREVFPIDVFPPLLKPLITGLCEQYQVSEVMVACSLLSALSSVVQPHVNILLPFGAESEDGTEIPCSLYFLLVVDSGGRKTTIDKLTFNQIEQYEIDHVKLNKNEAATRHSEIKIYDDTLQKLQTKIAAHNSEGTEVGDLTSRLQQHIESGRPRPLKVASLIESDFTIQAFAEALQSWPYKTIKSSEAGTLFGGHSMKKDNQMETLGTFCSLWDGAKINSKRISRGTTVIDVPRVSCFLQVQSKVYKAFIDGTAGLATDIGYAPRFLTCEPPNMLGDQVFRKAKAIPELLEFNSIIKKFLYMELPTVDKEKEGELAPRPLPLSPDAEKSFIAFYNEIQEGLQLGGSFRGIAAAGLRMPEQSARLACVLQMFEDPNSLKIDGPSMVRGVVLARWFLTEYSVMFDDGQISTSDIEKGAYKFEEWLLQKCRENNTDTVDLKEKGLYLPNAVRLKAARYEVLCLMEKKHRVKVMGDSVTINPALLKDPVSPYDD